MNDKVYSMLGLAQKSGKLVSGDETCEITIKSKKSFLVILAKDASERTKKKFNDMCAFRNIPILEYGLKDELGEYIGKGSRSIAAVKDVNFANRIKELIEEKVSFNGGESNV